jgi:hypothetical protein
MRKIFVGPAWEWSEKKDKDMWDHARADFQRDLQELYPTACKAKYQLEQRI